MMSRSDHPFQGGSLWPGRENIWVADGLVTTSKLLAWINKLYFGCCICHLQEFTGLGWWWTWKLITGQRGKCQWGTLHTQLRQGCHSRCPVHSTPSYKDQKRQWDEDKFLCPPSSSIWAHSVHLHSPPKDTNKKPLPKQNKTQVH